MQFITTPSSCFSDIMDYPFAENYISVADGMKMHYIDEGNKNDEVVLLLHGEPSWSYLYRKMIPIITEAGYRTIIPDLIGFGKSDKPLKQNDYSYAKHLEWIDPIFKKFDNINLFVQDWGGLIGLRKIEKYASKIRNVIVANSFLPIGKKSNEAFDKWKKFSQEVPIFPVGDIINMGTHFALSPEIIAAYDTPFPEEQYKAGARVFPTLVPSDHMDIEAIHNMETWKFLKSWEKPFLTLFSDQDPIMRGAEKIFQQHIPGCKNMPHEIIKDAGHFLQEDQGELLANKVVLFLKDY